MSNMSIEPSDAVPKAIEYIIKTNNNKRINPLYPIEDLEKGFPNSRVRYALKGLSLEDIQPDYD